MQTSATYSSQHPAFSYVFHKTLSDDTVIEAIIFPMTQKPGIRVFLLHPIGSQFSALTSQAISLYEGTTKSFLNQLKQRPLKKRTKRARLLSEFQLEINRYDDTPGIGMRREELLELPTSFLAPLLHLAITTIWVPYHKQNYPSMLNILDGWVFTTVTLLDSTFDLKLKSQSTFFKPKPENMTLETHTFKTLETATPERAIRWRTVQSALYLYGGTRPGDQLYAETIGGHINFFHDTDKHPERSVPLGDYEPFDDLLLWLNYPDVFRQPPAWIIHRVSPAVVDADFPAIPRHYLHPIKIKDWKPSQLQLDTIAEFRGNPPPPGAIKEVD